MLYFLQCLNYMCEFGGLFFGHGRPITMSACLPLEQHKTDCENLSRATLSKRMGQKICHHWGVIFWGWGLQSPLFINSRLLRLSCPLLTRLSAVCFYQHCPYRQATSDERTNGRLATNQPAYNIFITFLIVSVDCRRIVQTPATHQFNGIFAWAALKIKK